MDNNILLAKSCLEKNGFTVETFKNVSEAKETLLNEIQVSESIAFGGSMTLFDMGLYEDFKGRGNEIFWHWKAEDKNNELSLARNSHIYITSTNALTLDGKLVCMDGVGNRVSSMFYGHKRVYIIVGRNKICKDYDEARNRIKKIAAPKNAQRLSSNTPCRFTGECNTCDSADRICRVEVIIHRNPIGGDINIYLIDEDLGY
ncbi:lactate utilization protein [Clostridium sp. Cult3]|uniref:lactate utilization protein n=1 Tax=Clostridium sp. Cult3 TaxID=2079004 RepID=UPI001F2C412A|nr:lactate utilization protein [Clostridium sp. Cult3]MCF6459632.1 lactate utilization protein [Clostridium sp. Cult3]